MPRHSGEELQPFGTREIGPSDKGTGHQGKPRLDIGVAPRMASSFVTEASDDTEHIRQETLMPRNQDSNVSF